MVAGHGREKRIQQVVLFFVELGVVDAEDFVEFGASAVDLGQIQVVNDDGQRKLAEIIAVQFDFLDAFAKFTHLRFLGIVEQQCPGGTRHSRLTWLKKDRLVLWKWRRLAWIVRRVLPDSSFFHSVTT